LKKILRGAEALNPCRGKRNQTTNTEEFFKQKEKHEGRKNDGFEAQT